MFGGATTTLVEAPVTSAPAPEQPVVVLAREVSTMSAGPVTSDREIYELLEQDDMSIGARRRFRFRRGG